jgi:Putative peptidoglycan binding domain
VIEGEAGTAVRPPSGLRVSKRSWLILAAIAGVVVVVVVLVEGGVFTSSTPAAGVSDNPYPTSAARVQRGTLLSQTAVDATLGYAGSATIEMPSGTAPSALTQAQQQVSSASANEQSANATLTADSASLAQAQALLSAAKAKQAVDCAGSGAAQAASSGGGGGGACATDGQSVSADEQPLTGDQTKVGADQVQVSSAESQVAAAQASLGSAGSSAATWGQSSTYTSLPALGAIVRRGQSLFAVSDQPAFLLYGPVGAWRAFEAGMSPGRDVAELNANLQALGYGSAGLEGDAFTSETAAAIDSLQAAHGLSQTGELLLGSVVFEPGAVRVTAVTPTVGATVQPGPVLSVTSTKRQVVIELDAAQQSEVKVGDEVTITLPDNSTTPGRITYVGTVATTPSSSGDNGGGSSPTIEVDVTPTRPAATGKLDQAPVTVSITTASVKNALYVPVSALLALASGGYALEEIGPGGVHHLVAIQVGLFDDQSGDVQIEGGGVASGQKVVIPGE